MTKPGPCVSWAKTSSFMTHFYTNILPPGSSLTFLNTKGSQAANILICRTNFSVGRKDTVLLLKTAAGQGNIWTNSRHLQILLYFAHAFTLAFLLPLNLSPLCNGCKRCQRSAWKSSRGCSKTPCRNGGSML